VLLKQHVEEIMQKTRSACFLFLAAVIIAAAQPQPISYVASVKFNTDANPRSISEYSPGGRFTANAVMIGNLLRIAYRIQAYQLVGAPDWIGDKHFDISAKSDDSPAPSQQALLQALLKDRFKLEVHSETREMPVFALVVARSDERLGPRLTKSSFDCAAYMAGPRPLPQPGKTPNCGTNIGLGVLNGKSIPLSMLATSLASFAGRFTIDKTDLAGGYDVELKWTPDNIPANLPPGFEPPDPLGPSIFTAVQEQLGLKLVTDKARVPVLVVDRLELPTAN
jgi:uncharacterized protein (TIGR03435 family)